MTRLELDGDDRLSNLSTYERVTEYVEVLDRPFRPTLQGEEPSQALRVSQSFSSMGMEFGVRYYLGRND